MKILTFLFIIISSCCSCQEKKAKKESIYNKLPKELNEISGLTINIKGELFALNDEEGKIFRLSHKDFSIKKTIKFKEKGDYEGLCWAEGNFYVLKSNGSLLKVNENGDILRKQKVSKSFKNIEFEGIAYLRKNRQLLIACKNHPQKEVDSHINIYSASIDKLDIDSIPPIQFLKTDKLKYFKASGLAIDSNYLYILSGKSAQLIVYNLIKNNLEDVMEFESDELPQLEGVTLWNKKIIVVSEKANSTSAKLYRFNQK